MNDLVIYLLCGFAGGAFGGYLGLGGGIIMVPGLTIIGQVPMLTAVPASLTAIVVNSIAASNEYLKRGMVDFELVVVLSFFMVGGNIIGGTLSAVVPVELLRLTMAALMIYSAVSFIRPRAPQPRLSFRQKRTDQLIAAALLTFAAGIAAALLGIGGGIIIVPLLYLFLGQPLTTARGTSSFTIGFSAAAAVAVYYAMGHLDLRVASAVLFGSIIGAKAGGLLGTTAKPLVVRAAFFVVMIYLAFKMAWEPLQGWW